MWVRCGCRVPAGVRVLIAFGVISAALMVVTYGLESRGPHWIALFAAACAMTALYGVLSGAWLFAVLESIWAMVALRRFTKRRTTE